MRDGEYNAEEYGALTYELCVKNLNSLVIAYQAVFRSLVSISIEIEEGVSIPESWGIYLATITILAINPKTKTPWVQSLEFSTFGTIIFPGSPSQDRAWVWRFTYLNKCQRALMGWLKEIQENRVSKQRTEERNTQIKQELMQRIFE